jgi:hypothetical protein
MVAVVDILWGRVTAYGFVADTVGMNPREGGSHAVTPTCHNVTETGHESQIQQVLPGQVKKFATPERLAKKRISS